MAKYRFLYFFSTENSNVKYMSSSRVIYIEAFDLKARPRGFKVVPEIPWIHLVKLLQKWCEFPTQNYIPSDMIFMNKIEQLIAELIKEGSVMMLYSGFWKSVCFDVYCLLAILCSCSFLENAASSSHISIRELVFILVCLGLHLDRWF